MESLKQILFDDSLFFMRQALLLGMLASIPFGTIGSLVVARRITYLAAAIANAILAGIGFSLYAQSAWQWTWLHPLAGALFTGIIAALLVGWVSIRFKTQEDTLISAIWSVGMAIGLLFIFKTPQYIDPMSYLFGDILMISSVDTGLVCILALVVIIAAIVLYRPLVALLRRRIRQFTWRPNNSALPAHTLPHCRNHRVTSQHRRHRIGYRTTHAPGHCRQLVFKKTVANDDRWKCALHGHHCSRDLAQLCLGFTHRTFYYSCFRHYLFFGPSSKSQRILRTEIYSLSESDLLHTLSAR